MAQRIAFLEQSLEDLRELKSSLPPARKAAAAQKEIRVDQLKVKNLTRKLLNESRAVRAILSTMLEE